MPGHSYDITQTPRKSAKYYTQRTEPIRQEAVVIPQKRKGRFVFSLGLGMCFVVGCLMLWHMVVSPWIHGLSLQWHYGDNRVSVAGADVGHGGTSRFIAFDSENDIVIVEVVNRQYKVYIVPTGKLQNQLVTLSFKDVNDDGKVDLIVQIDGQEGVFVLFNTGDGFSLTK